MLYKLEVYKLPQTTGDLLFASSREADATCVRLTLIDRNLFTSFNSFTEVADVVIARNFTATEPGDQRSKSSTPMAPPSLTDFSISSIVIHRNALTSEGGSVPFNELTSQQHSRPARTWFQLEPNASLVLYLLIFTSPSWLRRTVLEVRDPCSSPIEARYERPLTIC